MVDELPVTGGRQAPLRPHGAAFAVSEDAPLPRPRRKTLALLVGRVTTIKLGYWAAVTATELALPTVVDRPFAARFPISVALAVLLSALALAWARVQAQAIDRRAGGIDRSLATVATTFATASVVAGPAFIPLLLIERARSAEGCAAGAACHLEALWLWAALFFVGFVAIPAVFAASLRTARPLT